MKKTILAITAAAVLLAGCVGKGDTPKTRGADVANTVEASFTDSRDGKTYRTVKIGKQTWMAENLNYNAGGSKCYGEGGEVQIGLDDENEPKMKTLSAKEILDNCARYGRLYDWSTAMNGSSSSSASPSGVRGICPTGWHLPSDAEWDALMVAVGGVIEGGYWWNYAGKKLKSKTGWNWNDYDDISGNGTDKYGFSALPGGNGFGVDFICAGYYGSWWSAREYDASEALSRHMSYDGEGEGHNDKANVRSVRCLQD